MGGMVVLGAGECGGRAAFALRDLGYDGPITLVGAEPHLPYERPPLSKEAITGDEDPVARTIAASEHYSESRIAIITAAATAIDRKGKIVELANGSSLAYDKLLLATGCAPRRLPLAGDGPRVAYLRTLEDAIAIRKRLVPGARLAVIGGGFIGLELAASARRRGASVIVIEAQPRILMRCVPLEIAEQVHALHLANDVEILCGKNILEIEDTRDAIIVSLDGGRRVEADLLLVGIGAVPNTALAEAAGLAVDNGVTVDATLATSDPDIYAAGDCCFFPAIHRGGNRVRLESWRNAHEQGVLAAKNMLGAAEPQVAVPWFWSDQYDHSLQIAGLAGPDATIVRRDIGDGAFLLFHLEDGRLSAVSGFGPGNAVARDVRLGEMLIARGACPPAEALASASVKLKSLLAA